MNSKKQSYSILIDKPLLEIVEIPNLTSISYKTTGGNITCKDGKTVLIASNKKEELSLKLAFQLALRYAKNWNKRFLLDVLKEGKDKKLTVRSLAINIRKLKSMSEELSKLDDEDILLFLHRASDFTGEYSGRQYSEVTAINALFALEMQVNKAYKKLRSTTTYLPKDPETHKKIQILHSYGRIKSHKHLVLLLALVGIRNKLAHAEWTELKGVQVQPLPVCIERRHKSWKRGTKAMQVLCGPQYSKNPNSYFTSDKRLKHETSRLILKKVIDAIMILHNLSL